MPSKKTACSQCLFWGPPGSGKTTLAQIIAGTSKSGYVPYSAVSIGVKEIKELAAKAAEDLKYSGRRTILFLDEIHRFNRSQQDHLLPHVENGTIILIGATTENPSFEVNSALLSRLRVFILEPLSPENIEQIIRRAISDTSKGLGMPDLEIEENAMSIIVGLAAGDARAAMNVLEPVAGEAHEHRSGLITPGLIEETVQKRSLLYDKSGEEHFNLISALHKSLRDSDPDAGLYWMGRMLEGGEDPLYIARRLVRPERGCGAGFTKSLGTSNSRLSSVPIPRNAGMRPCPSPGRLFFLAASPKSNSLEAAYIAVKEANG